MHVLLSFDLTKRRDSKDSFKMANTCLSEYSYSEENLMDNIFREPSSRKRYSNYIRPIKEQFSDICCWSASVWTVECAGLSIINAYFIIHWIILSFLCYDAVGHSLNVNGSATRLFQTETHLQLVYTDYPCWMKVRDMLVQLHISFNECKFLILALHEPLVHLSKS